MPPISVTLEQLHHAGAIEHLLDRAFGRDRQTKTAYRLRDGVAPLSDLCFVVEVDGRVDGTIRYWPVTIGGVGAGLLLGPIAVAPERQGEGLGACLIRNSLARAAALGHQAVLLVGDASYYGRFGFSAGLTTRLSLPGPVDRDRFLGLELTPRALAGANGMVETWRPRDTQSVARFAARLDGYPSWSLETGVTWRLSVG